MLSKKNRDWLVSFAVKTHQRWQKEGRTDIDDRGLFEDALVCALEELDDGWGVFVDPTRDEYDDMIAEIAAVLGREAK